MKDRERQQQRTSAGITYLLAYKKVKNINLRVRSNGTVYVSAPKRVPVSELYRFVASRAGWIENAKERMQRRAAEREQVEKTYTDEECLAYFERISAQIYPLFAPVLDHPPQIKVRTMKSRWGVCHYTRHSITLNKRLMEKPYAAVEYVILHEYVHFLYPDHQAGFHAMMAKLMPDYQQRRLLLR